MKICVFGCSWLERSETERLAVGRRWITAHLERRDENKKYMKDKEKIGRTGKEYHTKISPKYPIKMVRQLDKAKEKRVGRKMGRGRGTGKGSV
eukprot:759056-Hanusia_phi.AAC.2